MEKKDKLKMTVERELARHIADIRESVFDFVMLYVKKTDPELFEQDEALISNLLAIVSKAIDSEHLNRLDILLNKLDGSLDEFLPDDES
jgi:hypothetical protein